MANTKVTGDVIANGTISTVHLADDAITAAKLDSTATGITFADLTVDTDTLYVDAANNRVGIGTTLPTQALHVVGNIYSVSSGTDGGQIRLANSGGGSNWYWAARTTGLNLGELGAADGRIFIANGGSVGIGTTSPTMGLHIADTKGALFGSATAASTYISPTDENTINGGYGLDTDTADVWLNYRGYQDGFTRFRDTRIGNGKGSAIVMVDGSAGHVGIGTTSPERKLHVFKGESGGATSNSDSSLVLENSSNTYLQFLTPTTVESGILFGDTDNDVGALTYSHSTNHFNFRTAGVSNRMVIDSSGNVGIGTTSPVQPLHVNGQVLFRTTTVDGGKNRFQLIPGGSSDAANLYLYYGNSGDGTVSVRINAQGNSYFNGGNVGIGVTSPSQKLDVSGNAKADGFLSGKGTSSIAASGTSDIINMSGTNGIYTVAVRVAGGSDIYIANAVFISHSSNSQYIKAQDVYNGSNVTLSVSSTNVRITNNGFGTLTWEWSYFFQPFN